MKIAVYRVQFRHYTLTFRTTCNFLYRILLHNMKLGMKIAVYNSNTAHLNFARHPIFEILGESEDYVIM